MMRTIFRHIYASFLLLILLSAYAGQKVHIYTEDPLHFAAFSGDLVPDNGADCMVVERCVVDDYFFFPFLAEVRSTHTFYSRQLAVLLPLATHCKRCDAVRYTRLRAPPTA